MIAAVDEGVVVGVFVLVCVQVPVCEELAVPVVVIVLVAVKLAETEPVCVEVC